MNRIVLFAIIASVSSFLNAQQIETSQKKHQINFSNVTNTTQPELASAVIKWKDYTINSISLSYPTLNSFSTNIFQPPNLKNSHFQLENTKGFKLSTYKNSKMLDVITTNEYYIIKIIPENQPKLASVTELLYQNNIKLIINSIPTRLA